MLRKEADLVVAPIAATVDRDEAMDFTEPFYLDYTTVLVQLPDPDASKWNLYVIVSYKYTMLCTPHPFQMFSSEILEVCVEPLTFPW